MNSSSYISWPHSLQWKSSYYWTNIVDEDISSLLKFWWGTSASVDVLRTLLELRSASTSRDVLRDLLSSVETIWQPESNGTLKCLFSVWNQGPGYCSPGPGTHCVDVAGHREITWLCLLRLKVCATMYGLFWLFVMFVDSIRGRTNSFPVEMCRTQQLKDIH